jgi:hypothetical protein
MTIRAASAWPVIIRIWPNNNLDMIKGAERFGPELVKLDIVDGEQFWDVPFSNELQHHV